MRINQFIAHATGMSRRAADKAIEDDRVLVNHKPPQAGQQVDPVNDTISLDKAILELPESPQTIIMNKPTGYVCSRDGQSSKTIYDLLPPELHQLKPVGRLDKDSSGLLLLTNDGKLAHQLTHPSFQKEKIYEIEIDKPLKAEHFRQITTLGVDISGDYVSRFQIHEQVEQQIPSTKFLITLTEGKNRQIRRTFDALGYKVTKLHRTNFGPHKLDDLATGSYKEIL